MFNPFILRSTSASTLFQLPAFASFHISNRVVNKTINKGITHEQVEDIVEEVIEEEHKQHHICPAPKPRNRKPKKSQRRNPPPNENQ